MCLCVVVVVVVCVIRVHGYCIEDISREGIFTKASYLHIIA